MTTDDGPDLSSAIAVVGMACRFPGANDPDTFWRNLCEGVESIQAFSREQCLRAGVTEEKLSQPGYVTAGAPIDEPESFDAALFGITPREASFMDPQHRILLECAWEVLERAGCDPERFAGPIGMFAGTTASTYLMNQLVATDAWHDEQFRDEAIYGSFPGFLATRASYKLGLRGPSIMVQTACSSGLVAIHLAVKSLLDYECDMALAGGVTVQVPQARGYLHEPDGILSPDGHCRPFDAEARGTVFGNGAGLVALKRLDDALRDGDDIAAVVLGTAVNNDGSAKAGFTAPSPSGQAEVVAMAQAVAGVDPRWVTFVEAHGTGTPIGDPIEVAALTRVFRARTADTGFCALGSVKANIGHLDAAAGIAGFIKTVLAIRHGSLPPVLHFRHPNPRLELATSPFHVNDRAMAWAGGSHGRIAGISSFGFGGTNAHAVLAQAPERPAGEPASRPVQLLALSAAGPAALQASASRLRAFLEAGAGGAGLADVAFTLQAGRRLLPFRHHVVATDLASAAAALARPPAAAGPALRERAACFLFPGQGAQYAGMGAGLYETEPAWRAAVDRCAQALLPALGEDIRAAMFDTGEGADARLARTRLTQPALFTAAYATAQLWMSWGVTPTAMLGHSIGEYVAACLAGVMSLEDALAVVARRGELMQAQAPGEMLAVLGAEAEVAALLVPGVEIAAVNAPEVTVCAGPPEAIVAARGRLEAAGLECRPLRTSHAFHSAMMAPALEPFREFLASIRLDAPRIPFLSNLTGTWITPEQACDPGYWTAHLRGTVRFSAGIGVLLEDPTRVLLECGPGSTLSSLVRRRDDASGTPCIPSMRGARDEASDAETLVEAAGRFWACGGRVDWQAFHGGRRRLRVALPPYPFQRHRHWIDAGPRDRVAAVADPTRWCYVPSWRRRPFNAPPGAMPAGPWLVLGGAQADGVAEALGVLSGGNAIQVTPGSQFEALGERRYALDVGDSLQLEMLWQRLAANGTLPRSVFQLLLDEPAGDPTSIPELEHDLHRGLFALLGLAKAAGSRFDATEPVRMVVATRGACAVTGEETVAPGRAAAVSAARGIGEEYESVAITLVDVASVGDPADLAGVLCREAAHAVPASVVAIRGQSRWEPGVEPLRLPAPPAADPGPVLRQGGSYLVTGGFGGLGAAFARYLARHCKARLTLVSRGATGDGPQAVASQADARAALVRELEALGAQVLAVGADMATAEGVAKAIDAARARFGALNGVIHAAGLAGGGVIDAFEPERALRIFRPKVHAMLLLSRALADQPLDWFFACSSLVTTIPVAGQLDYTAANQVLDALPAALRGRVRWPFMVAAWDRWTDIGMAAQPAGEPARSAAVQLPGAGIAPEEGAATFARLLAAAEPVVYVATFDLVARLAGGAATTPSFEIPGAIPGQGPGAELPDRQPGRPYRAPATPMQQGLVAIWENLLGVAPVGIDDNFFELGGDSLLALRVAARVRRDLKRDMKPNLLFEASTIAALEAALAPPAPPAADKAAALRARIDAMSPEEIRSMLERKRNQPAKP